MPVKPAQHDVGPLSQRVLPADTHKANHAEVLLRRWRPTAADSFAISAEWSARHGFYTSRLGLYDPMLLAETVRQCLPLLSHAAYRVPPGHQLLWKDLEWVMDPGAALVTEDHAELELQVECDEVKYRGDRASAMTLSVDVTREGRPLAAARTRFTIQDGAVYRRLRGSRADAATAMAQAVPLPPPGGSAAFGRDRLQDVVLASTGTPDRWQLRVDTAHPVLFDHPVDHVPGMLLLEAARQAALATAHPRPTAVVGMQSTFARYADLDAPCWIETRESPDSGTVRVTAHQYDRELFHSTVTLVPVPERP